jgi:LuxR family transcriptional regulator, maltose regulon positive regulatory protein
MSTLAAPRLVRLEQVAEPVAPGRLRPPPLRAGVVERPRLSRRLDTLAQQPLTVVAAPTGYGKTTLLASWAASTRRRVAWASLGSPDLDAEGFWALAAAALQRAEPRLRIGLRAGGPTDDRPARLATALGPLSQELTLVLDGYEQATRSGVDPDFRRFLELAPDTLHVVVSSRGEPGLALPLRRARGTAAELGTGDLAFDEDETTAVLRRSLGNGATDVDTGAVARRTEGWPAGVYLAALEAQGAADPAEAIAGFSGASRDVADYLRLELLDAQRDETLRSFLLDSSMLERLSAPLCDVLRHRRDSSATLRELVRRGSFLVPLEGLEREYRYLQPVREFLRAELSRIAPARFAELQRSAAAACERAGAFEEAADHARQAGGEDDAANLLTRHALELVRSGRTEHLELLLATRTGAVAARQRPALGAELHRFARAGSDVPALAAAAERLVGLGARLPSGPVTSLLQSTAEAARAYAFLLSGSVAEAYEAGAAAFAAADPDSGAPAGQAAAVASLAAARLGLGAVAAPLSRASVSALTRRGVRSGTAVALADLAQAAVAEERGGTDRAERLCVEAVEHAADSPARTLALLQLARLRRSDPDAAYRALEEAQLELARCEGAALLEMLVAETQSMLGPCDASEVATGELSSAEQRVLRLLVTKLTQREIANELYVSPNTVKTHARMIYRKLGVGSRAGAVTAARELNLV